MISKCVTGKKDGIAAFYNSSLLPEKYRLGKTAATSSLESQLKEYVSRSLQPLFYQIVADEAVLKACVPDSPYAIIPQKSHHTTLLMNRFNHQLGYSSLEGFDGYDPFTYVLLDEFVELVEEINETGGDKARTALKAIFKKFKIGTLRDRIKESFASMLQKSDALQFDLSAFFKGKGINLSPEEIYILDDDSFPTGITSKAALFILNVFGVQIKRIMECDL